MNIFLRERGGADVRSKNNSVERRKRSEERKDAWKDNGRVDRGEGLTMTTYIYLARKRECVRKGEKERDREKEG